MKVILTGIVQAFRYADVKGGNKVGQIDLLQAGDSKRPAKIISVYIPSSAYVRLILEHTQKHQSPIISLLVNLTFTKDIEIDVIELLSVSVPEGAAAQ